jgi:hypothetical protein
MDEPKKACIVWNTSARHAQHLGLVAVEVDEQLLAVGAEGGVDACSSGRGAPCR